MTANPQDFAYFKRGELPKPTKGSHNSTGFDHFNRGEVFPAAIPSTGTGAVAVALGGLSITTAGTPTVGGAVTAALGGLTVVSSGTATVKATVAASLGSLTITAAGVPSVTGTVVATLGSLTVTTTGTPSVTATVTAALGALIVTAASVPAVTGTVNAALGALTVTAVGTGTSPNAVPAGGNLTKPRLHLGNFPGRKEHTAEGTLAYRLTLYGTGELETLALTDLPVVRGHGEICGSSIRSYTRTVRPEGCVRHASRLELETSRRGTGTASEDADDILVLLSL